MKPTIAIMSASKYCNRDYERMGGKYYRQNGYDVVFVSMYDIFYPGKAHINVTGETVDVCPYFVYSVSSISSLRSLLSDMGANIELAIGYVDFASPDIRIVKLLRAFALLPTSLVFYHGNAIPFTCIDDRKNLLERVFRKIVFFSYFKCIALLNFFGFLSQIKVVLGSKANELFLDGRFVPYQKYFAHTIDYELAENLRTPKLPALPDKYVVFLDEFAPFHPDNEIVFGYSLSGYAKEYYGALNRLFALLEAQGYAIAIAAHPRSRYTEPEYSWCFDGRMVVKGQTAALVRDSDFCVGHLSASFNYAVMFNKPIIQLRTKMYIEVPDLFEAFGLVRDGFGLSQVDIDTDKPKIPAPSINQQKYAEYKEMYIKTKDSPDKSIYEVFLDAAKNEC